MNDLRQKCELFRQGSNVYSNIREQECTKSFQAMKLKPCYVVVTCEIKLF